VKLIDSLRVCLTIFFPCNMTIDFYNATENLSPSCKCWVGHCPMIIFFLKSVFRRRATGSPAGMFTIARAVL
jgi:hypothetical protein